MIMYYCECCKKACYKKYGSGRFCCSYCARKFSTMKNRKLINYKIAQSLIKHYEKKATTKLCKICGQPNCTYPYICKSFFIKQKSKNLKKLGFDFSKIGTPEIYDEFFKLKNKIYQEYVVNGINLQKTYNIPSSKTIDLLLKFLEIHRRNHREAAMNSIKQYGLSNKLINIKYKTGYFIDRYKISHFYRSSLELHLMKILNQKHFKFKTEALKIPYFDSSLKKMRIAIPDIYIPSKNLIIEIKSSYTYDKSNMIDKAKAYRKHGYYFRLYLNNKLYKRCI